MSEISCPRGEGEGEGPFAFFAFAHRFFFLAQLITLPLGKPGPHDGQRLGLDY